ncbi:MAG: endolytic transglycosylase MltG, partial [Chitinivibrionales bacterium]|nr:endolytic transglycosylase MltG [Chitinivibrionales bacterium]
MARVTKPIRGIGRLWLTGALCILAAFGYVFYGLLWTVRMVQTMKKLLLVLVVLGLACAGLALWCLFGSVQGKPVELIVAPGQPLATIARELERKDVVCSSFGLIAWMKLTGADKKVQAGRHAFVQGEGIASATEKLQHAIPIEEQVTIPEGLTLEQTAAVVGAVFAVDSASFVAACADTQLLRRLGLAAETLEGYLFPDTYRFPPDVTAKDVVHRMVAEFLAQYAKVEIDSAVGERLSRHEIVTLASIVEREATVASEQGRIAGVFHNRLRLGYPLGADPTVRYALRKFEGPLRVSELNSRNPYNTRVHRGLPPGPICSPGFGALQAAAKPMNTKDLYFVAKWDGSGEHDFSRTLA